MSSPSLNAEKEGRPRYDWSDEGLGRRRGLRQAGIDPDEIVTQGRSQNRNDAVAQNEPLKAAE